MQRVSLQSAAQDFSDVEDTLASDSDSDGGYESMANLDQARRQYPGRLTTDRAQPAAGFGRSRYGIHPADLPTLRHDKQGRQAPRIAYRADSEPLYRWDTRTPDAIFPEGFKSWNVKLPKSLRSYQKTLKESRRSALVSATRSNDGYIPEWAIRQDGLALRYTIRAPGGMDLVESLGTVAFHQQQEVAFWKGIRPEFIEGVDIYRVTGTGANRSQTHLQSMPNPQFGVPQRDPDAMDVDT
ncbi:scabin-related ADP-ribosyltransferase [Streptomyces cadmiisoli]|uniref:scabin-related ADP-ribosyltransferase n=1 Tax=Streptomyces cadmiisoli TaxID=2184053 RepID=UPI00365CC431